MPHQTVALKAPEEHTVSFTVTVPVWRKHGAFRTEVYCSLETDIDEVFISGTLRIGRCKEAITVSTTQSSSGAASLRAVVNEQEYAAG